VPPIPLKPRPLQYNCYKTNNDYRTLSSLAGKLRLLSHLRPVCSLYYRLHHIIRDLHRAETSLYVLLTNSFFSQLLASLQFNSVSYLVVLLASVTEDSKSCLSLSIGLTRDDKFHDLSISVQLDFLHSLITCAGSQAKYLLTNTRGKSMDELQSRRDMQIPAAGIQDLEYSNPDV
jgi:hypothetical protein